MIITENLTRANINSGNTICLVIDMMNDICKEEGAFAQMGLDISRFNIIEKNVIEIINHCHWNSIIVVYVTSIYDPNYLPLYLKWKFSDLGVFKFKMSLKGTWGAKTIDSLPNVNEYSLIKSHNSAFANNYSLMFNAKTNRKLLEYLSKTADEDDKYKARGEKVLNDYYLESTKMIGDKFMSFESNIFSLEYFLKSNSINNIIFLGGSTHVCIAATCYSASERSYNTIIPMDAIASEDSDKHTIYLDNFNLFTSIVTTTNLLLSKIKTLQEV